MDLITSLPDNLIETILIKLPFRDAIRTSTLSKKWRNSWVKIPHLKLDAVFWQQSLQNDIQFRASNFYFILSRIFFFYQGPITEFCLEVPQFESTPVIEALMPYIVRKGLQKCHIDMFPGGGHYKLYSSLFTCPTLIDLYLRFCEVMFLPSTFEGFRNLTRLSLVDILISVQALGSLVSSCPSLQILRLKISINISCLEINAPKLVYFLYYYSQSSLEVDNQQQEGTFKLLGKFPDLKYLCMDGHYVKSLFAGLISTRVSTVILSCLKSIKLVHICLEDVDQFSSVLCLIRSSPNLQELQLDRNKRVTSNNTIGNLQVEEDYFGLTPNRLVEVKMLSIVGGRSELKLIKILLAKSPSLRKMTIGLKTSIIADKRLKIIKELCMFRRAAPNVEVCIKD